MKLLWAGNGFLVPLLSPDCEMIPAGRIIETEWHGAPWASGSEAEIEAAISDNADADFLFVMNTHQPPNSERPADTLPYQQAVRCAAKIAREQKLPVAWWSIEDPNAFNLGGQAEIAECVFTSCRTAIPRYREVVGHDRVFWLPLAAQPAIHKPLPLAEDAADLVHVGNHYPWWPAKVAFLENALLPLVRAGYSLALYSYEADNWPEEVRPFWRGKSRYLDSAECYRHGRIALGSNCQAGGDIDQFKGTTMCSMRVFEALACGKPLLAFWSEAYEALGFGRQHLAIASRASAALEWADVLLRTEKVGIGSIGDGGMDFVLDLHTYSHRLSYLRDVICGGLRKPLEFA